MPSQDPRVDAYIGKAAEFAQPILRHVRELVHTGCPDVEETMKWSFPNFMYKGMLCSMAAFKEHCSFGFWKAQLILGRGRAGANTDAGGMGQFGRISKLSDLPKDSDMLKYLKEAVRLNDEGVKLPARPKSNKPKTLVVPDYLSAALKKNKKALATFDGFSYSHRKEYVEWLTEAKTEETRQRRLQTTLVWLAEGKPRNWKYMNC
jgi:uncharacterized protein YdeI (YjbR/CyaY-like superfamily)